MLRDIFWNIVAHVMQLLTDPAVHNDNEWFPFQKDFLWYVYRAQQFQCNTTVDDLWPCKPRLPCGFLPMVGEVGRYIVSGGYLKK